MAGKDRDHREGLAEQSLNTSIVPPAQGNSVDPGPSAGDRTLTGNDQREGLERTDPADPQSNDSSKP